MAKLTTQEQQKLTAAYNARDREAYYTVLENAGIKYGELAKGVVTGETLSGSMANVFMAEMARKEYGALVDQDMAKKISIDLMNADYLARRNETFNDIGYEEIQQYHDRVFTANGLGREVWTASAVLDAYGRHWQVLGYSSAAEAKQEVWTQMLEGGTRGQINVLNTMSALGGYARNSFVEPYGVTDGHAGAWADFIDNLTLDEGLYIQPFFPKLRGSPYPPDDWFCFLAGTLITMSAGTKKPIEEILPNDMVLSYDKNGTLMPGRVVRIFRNEVKHILDVFGLMVTPGHSTLCGEGKYAGRHVPILDILRTDGALVKSDGSLVRAATGSVVGSYEDRFVQLAIGELGADGTVAATHRGQVRIGTRFITEDGKDIAIADLLRKAGAVVGDDGLVTGPGLAAPVPLHLGFLTAIPQPEDYILERSCVTLAEIYRASEWEEGARPIGLPPMRLDGGPVEPDPLHEREIMPRNIPLAFRQQQDEASAANTAHRH